MLEELSISSLGVIEEATVEFGPGLNVVTGETGAGKTLVVTALGLLLGARADAGLVRQGAPRARVEGRLRLESAGAVARRVDDLGAELDEGTLLLARTVSAEGRSRAHAGAVAVPAGVLSALASDLVVVHGQADQQQLLQPSRQRACLDAYGDVEAAHLRSYAAIFDRLRVVETELTQVTTTSRERAREADLLRFGLAEIAAADPQTGEEVAILAEEERLGHVDTLRRAADEARLALSGDEFAASASDALSQLVTARKALESARQHDPRLAELSDALASASYVVADLAADVASYASSLDVDPNRLAWVQERRAVVGRLLKKYGDSVDEVLAWASSAEHRLSELDDGGSRVEALSQERESLRAALLEAGRKLTAQRRELGWRLAEQVTRELSGLAMPHAVFEVRLTPLAQPARSGLDDVSFLLAADGTAEPRPLQRSASGGELSRVMLGLEVCLAGSRFIPTAVFDEVDAGVGGKAAVEVGRRLARLARSGQVIVVTHLPQVAAFADRHFAVAKTSDGRVTSSGVNALDDAGVRKELSRMLAGLEGSASALTHADELVDLARAERLS